MSQHIPSRPTEISEASPVSKEAVARGLERLTPEERSNVEAELQRLTKEASALSADVENPEARKCLSDASRSLGSARDGVRVLDLDDLRNARQDANRALQIAHENIERFRDGRLNPAHVYGFITVEEAVVCEAETIQRVERELAEINDAFFRVIEVLWEETFPAALTLSAEKAEHELVHDQRYLEAFPFDAEHEFKAKLWEEIHESGLNWASEAWFGVATDVCVSMSEFLDTAGMLELVQGLRAKDTRRISSLLSRLAVYEQQKGYDLYNVVRVTVGSGGKIRLVIDQRPNPLYRPLHLRSSGLMQSSRRRWGSRQRSSRGRASRIRGSRRVTSRSAGGGGSSDDPDSEGSLSPSPPSRGREWRERTEWEAAMAATGMGMGYVLGQKGVAVAICGMVACLWARCRWE